MPALKEQAQAGGAIDTSTQNATRLKPLDRTSRAANPSEHDEHRTQIVRS